MTQPIVVTLPLLLLRRLSTPTTPRIAVTLPLLLPPSTLHSIDSADCRDFAFAAKKICSKRWSHCPETIVSKGTGTLSVAKEGSPKVDDRDVDHRRLSVFDLKDLSDLSDLKDTTPCSRVANVP